MRGRPKKKGAIIQNNFSFSTFFHNNGTEEEKPMQKILLALVICAFLRLQCISKLLGGVENNTLCTSFVYCTVFCLVSYSSCSLSHLLCSRQSISSWTSALPSPRSSSFCEGIRRGLAFSATTQIPILRMSHQVIFPQIILEEKVWPCSSDRRALSMVRRYEHHAKYPAVHCYGTRKSAIVPITKWTLIHAWWADIAKMSQTMFKPLSLVREGVVTL